MQLLQSAGVSSDATRLPRVRVLVLSCFFHFNNILPIVSAAEYHLSHYRSSVLLELSDQTYIHANLRIAIAPSCPVRDRVKQNPLT
jgi:hypothetical protein